MKRGADRKRSSSLSEEHGEMMKEKKERRQQAVIRGRETQTSTKG